ncbi:hypothetical protein BCR43DRAFT_8839 [Syncephalastrum racemosum]|uniref:Uncharacterized protein n=1 Tax=Syncephalastrum racemosum TaxID=13706 RepID=A0A1X2HS58_SYNRA|nr:hypothetical protein BCR43DRAFT_8839 [Syncephalastrum racemosum]
MAHRASIYDTLPVLDSWYKSSPDEEEKAISPPPVAKMRPTPTGDRRSVSFSTSPPSVHYIHSPEPVDSVQEDVLPRAGRVAQSEKKNNFLIRSLFSSAHGRVKRLARRWIHKSRVEAAPSY